MSKFHLVILKKPYLQAILDGRKTVESRFTLTRRPGFVHAGLGDTLFLKISSGPVCATAKVDKVEKFCDLTPTRMTEIKKRYNKYILGPDQYWDSKSNSKFGMLVWLTQVRQIEPVRISKRDWRAWVVLNRQQHYGLLERQY